MSHVMLEPGARPSVYEQQVYDPELQRLQNQIVVYEKNVKAVSPPVIVKPQSEMQRLQSQVETYRRVEGVPPPLVVREPAPFTGAWLVRITEKALEFDPWTTGANIAEKITGKQLPANYRRTFEAINPTKPAYITNVWGQRVDINPWTSIKEFAYVPAGAASVPLSFVRPETPTLVGSTVSFALSGNVDVFAEEKAMVTRHPGYLFGELVGEYYTGKAFGWGVGKAYSGLKRFTPEIIKQPLAKASRAASLWRIEHLPSYRGSRLDVWLAKHSGWYYQKTGGIAVGEVAIPDVSSGALSMGKLRAAEASFDFTLAPRTGGVWTGKYFVEPLTKAPVLHTIIRGGVISSGYLRELSFQRETMLTPLVSQQQLTRMGIYPYVPKLVGRTVGTTAITVAGYGASAMFRPYTTKMAKPAVENTMAAMNIMSSALLVPERLKRKKSSLTIVPRSYVESLPYQRLKYNPLEMASQKQKQETSTLLVPRLTLKTSSKLNVPDVPLIPPTQASPPTITLPPFRIPGSGGGRRRGRKNMYGKWFKKHLAIKTPSEMLKTYTNVDLNKYGKKRGGRKQRFSF